MPCGFPKWATGGGIRGASRGGCGPQERKAIRLKGLDPGRSYWVFSEDGSVALGERQGKDLLDEGITVELPEPFSSDLVFLCDSSAGRPAGLEAPGGFRLGKAEASSDAFAARARLAWETAAGARSYRLTVASDPQFQEILARKVLLRSEAVLERLPPGRTLHWKVEAVAWGGLRQGEGGPGTFITPVLESLQGVLFLSDIPWARSTAGALNQVRRDANYHGKPIAIAGKSYPKGLWTHSFDDGSPADIVVDIAGKDMGIFAADAGVEDSAGGGSIQFQVLLDGALKAESPVLQPGSMHRFQVEVARAREITLRVLNGGDGYASDHAAWGLARLIGKGAKDPLDRRE